MDPSSLPPSRPKPGGGGGGRSGSGVRRTRTKNRGSQTCSSSDDDFHSDDNLRPYEEVKIAHHDKKLTGLGLTPDEHAVSPLGPSAVAGGVPPPLEPTQVSSGPPPTGRAPRAYSYGSEEEADQREPAMVSRSAVPLLHQGRPLPDRVVYDPPWDQINFEHAHAQHRPLHSAESDEDNRLAAQHRYSHAATLPMSGGGAPLPPPTFPPPPPPPIEDIPQRSPAALRQYSFGPSFRGNYADADFRRQPSFPEAEVERENMVLQNSPGGGFALQAAVGQSLLFFMSRGSAMASQGLTFVRIYGAVLADKCGIWEVSQDGAKVRVGAVVPGPAPGWPPSPHHLNSLHSTSGYNSDTYPYHCPTNPDHPMLTLANSVDRERDVIACLGNI
ncbi:hypothetical protein ACOMHN_043769 [Nucella lapillus]